MRVAPDDRHGVVVLGGDDNHLNRLRRHRGDARQPGRAGDRHHHHAVRRVRMGPSGRHVLFADLVDVEWPAGLPRAPHPPEHFHGGGEAAKGAAVPAAGVLLQECASCRPHDLSLYPSLRHPHSPPSPPHGHLHSALPYPTSEPSTMAGCPVFCVVQPSTFGTRRTT